MTFLRKIKDGLYEESLFESGLVSVEEMDFFAQTMARSDLWTQAIIRLKNGEKNYKPRLRQQLVIQFADATEELRIIHRRFASAFLRRADLFGKSATDLACEVCQLQKGAPGSFFKWHKDQTTDNRRCFVGMAYFSDFSTHNLIGGETEFDLENSVISITPVRGRALFFHPDISHQGRKVVLGTKYTIVCVFRDKNEVGPLAAPSVDL